MKQLKLELKSKWPSFISRSPGRDLGLDDRNQPLEAFDASGHLGNSATLSCKLTTGRHNRGWFRLSWSRIEHDGTSLQIVHFPVRDKIPSWGGKVHSRLKVRVTPLITIQPGHVEFNIRFDNLTCDDEAEYRCTALTLQGERTVAADLGIFGVKKTVKKKKKRKEEKEDVVCQHGNCQVGRSSLQDKDDGVTDQGNLPRPVMSLLSILVFVYAWIASPS